MKRFLTWDGILFTVLFLGFTVVSVSLVHYSYAWADEYSVALKYAMRIIGFIGTIYLPTKFVAVAMEVVNDEVIDDLQNSYNELWQQTVCAGRPDDEDYKEDE